MNTATYSWIPFYTAFADRLADYKNDRKTLIEILQKAYRNIDMRFPKLESDGNIIDIDPFTIFGMFNKGITDSNRIAIIKEFSKEFNINTEIPDSFEGIPVLNNLMANFFGFLPDRNVNDINNLWELFIAALIMTNDDTEINRNKFIYYYDATLNQPCVKWNITMGLYWIRPYFFMNLDSRNRWFASNIENMPADFAAKIAKMKKVPSAKEYLSICSSCKAALKNSNYEYKNFPALSYYAWIISEQINQEKKGTNKSTEISKAAFLRWFNPLIQALRDLGGSASPLECRNKIIENENLKEAEINQTRGKNKVNKFENEVAFARNYLVYSGYIDKSVRGVWTLTEKGYNANITDELATEIFRNGIEFTKNKRENKGTSLPDEGVESIHYWLYAPGENAKHWEEFYNDGIMAIGWEEMGDFGEYSDKNEMQQKMKEIYGNDSSYKNSAHATWQFCNDIKVDDIVFVKNGRKEIIGCGIVTSDYEYDSERQYYNNIRRINWVHKGSWGLDIELPTKTLTDITPYTDMVNRINALFSGEISDDERIKEIIYPIYTVDNFLEEVFMSESNYNNICNVLKKKKNIILQGAPGVGKTYVAKRLAYSLMGVKNIERVMLVQFHQSYSYEDFIEGYRPSGSSFELKKGAFYTFCKAAEVDSDNDYFFIIDEINRGNLSKIFGELFMLIEADKRGDELRLLYSDEKFSVPKNVYIIGMMNTADRSLALLDYALRRRFAFVEMKPAFATEEFRAYQAAIDNEMFDRLIVSINNLNSAIANDDSLGEGFCIGHSYFCNFEADNLNDDMLRSIVEYEIIPLIREYWFDEPDKIRTWTANLRSAVK